MGCRWYKDDRGVLVHISFAEYTGYYVLVRKPGFRKWQNVSKRTYKTQETAYRRLCKEIASGKFKRGVVMAIDKSPYYDPSVVAEINVKRMPRH